MVYGIENNTGKYLKDIDGSGTYEFSTVTINDIDFNLNPNVVVVSDNDGSLNNSIISTTKLNYLYNVSTDIQTKINNKQDILSASNLLNASYIGTGVVDNTEFNYLNGVTSSIQTQLNAKQSTLFTNTSGSIKLTADYNNWDFRRWSPGGGTFKIGSDITASTGTYSLIISDPDYSSGFEIMK